MKKNDMEKDEIPKLILRLAIPTMLAQFVNVLYSIVDRMFIGHIAENGNLALAGVGVCGPIVAVLVSFAYLVGQGGTPLMAMQMGARDKKSASEIVSNCLRILLILGVVLTCVFLLLRRQFLWWFGASEATFPYGLTYLTIHIYGTIFALISGGMNSFLIAQGRSDLGMGTVLIGTVLNVVLDPIFIFTLKMGVAGAAWATILSQAFSAIFALYCLRRTNFPVRLVWEKFRPDLCKKVLSLGFAPFLTYALDSTLLIILNATLQRTGGHGEGDILVMSTAIIQSYMLLITSPLGGITLGCQGVVSFNFGAGDYE